MSLGIQNINQALSRHTRPIVEDDWIVGANATTTVIPVTLADGTAVSLSSAVQDILTGVAIELIDGTNRGVTRQVVAISASGTLTLDSALPGAPGSGIALVLIDLAASAGSGSNSNAIGTVDDVTIPANTRSFLASGEEIGVGTVDVYGAYRINGAIYAGDDWTQHEGSRVVLGAGSKVVLNAWHD